MRYKEGMSLTKTEEIIEHVRMELHSEKTKEKYRQKAQDFTRRCGLTFERVGMMVLRGHKISIQNGLNKMFSGLGMVQAVVSAGAYSHARHPPKGACRKVKPELFAHLNTVVCEDFYKKSEAEGGVKRTP